MNRDAHGLYPLRDIFHDLLEGAKVRRHRLAHDLVVNLHYDREAIVLKLALGDFNHLALDLHHDVLRQLAAERITRDLVAHLLDLILEALTIVGFLFSRPGHQARDRLGVLIPDLRAVRDLGAQAQFFHAVDNPVALVLSSGPYCVYGRIIQAVPHLWNQWSPLLAVDVDHALGKFLWLICAVFRVKLPPAHLEAQAEHAILAHLALSRVRLGDRAAINALGHVTVDVGTGCHEGGLVMLARQREHGARLDAAEVSRHNHAARGGADGVAQTTDHALDGLNAGERPHTVRVARHDRIDLAIHVETDRLVGAAREVVRLEQAGRLPSWGRSVISK